MKRLLVFGFVLLAINLAKFSVSAHDTECSKPSTLKILALRSKLLCDYDILSRPSEMNTTIVMFRLIPKFIEFDDTTHTLTIDSWTSLSWEDPHFQWADDPEYSKIYSIHVSSDEIWKPDLSVYNSGAIGYEGHGIPTTTCVVLHKRVTCLPPMKYVARCIPDYQHWPFDKQNCTLRLGSWIHPREELDYRLPGDGIYMDDITENPEWKVLSIEVTKEMLMFNGWGEVHPSVLVNIILERRSTHRGATILAPAILLIIMTLAVLWLNPMTIERMILAGLNLICHLICVMDVHWEVPFNGASTPSILVFHQNSMIIASVAFFLTAFLRQLKETSIPAPDWLTSTISLILASRAGQFILLTTLDPKAAATLETIEDDNAGLVQSNPSAPKSNPEITTWHHLANLIDRLSFTAVVFTYAIMLLVLIPKNDIKDG